MIRCTTRPKPFPASMLSTRQGRQVLLGAEGARRATGDPATGADGSVPDPAVSEKAKRRRFTTEYKLHILQEVDQCKASGEVGAILRREGLYSSNLTFEGLAKKKRGPKAKPEDPRVKELEREDARLKRRLQRAEAMLEIQKKVSELLGIPLSQLDQDDRG